MNTNGASAPGLDALEVGDEMTTRGRTITEADVVSFAALTGDWHPQHGDAEWAAQGRFGQRVAHGMLVLSYAVGLVPLDPARVIALRGLESVVFKRPVHLGDTIRVAVRVEDRRPLEADTELVTLRWRVLNQAGKTVLVARVGALCRGDARTGRTEDADPERQPVFL